MFIVLLLWFWQKDILKCCNEVSYQLHMGLNYNSRSNLKNLQTFLVFKYNFKLNFSNKETLKYQRNDRFWISFSVIMVLYARKAVDPSEMILHVIGKKNGFDIDSKDSQSVIYQIFYDLSQKTVLSQWTSFFSYLPPLSVFEISLNID